MIFSLSLSASDKLSWDGIFEWIESSFPEAEDVSIDEYKRMLVEGEDVLVIDVREEKEFAVSRIPGAVRMTSRKEIELIAKESGKKVILYCSVGYRSSKITEKLRKSGLENVYNLKGSIFEWSNSGNVMEDSEGETKFVHPYNKKWGQLLDAGKHRY